MPHSELSQRLVVPVNGGPGDHRALAVVARIADRSPVLLTLIYVVEVPQSMPLDAELPVEIDRGEAVLRRAEEIARSALPSAKGSGGIHRELLQARAAGAAIVDEALERGANAIVMAGRMRSRHGKPTLGDTVAYVLKHAPVEVILVRQAPPGATAASADEPVLVGASQVGGTTWR